MRLLVRGDGTRVVAARGDRKFFSPGEVRVERRLTPWGAYREICPRLRLDALEPPEDAGHPVDPEVGYRVLELLSVLWRSGIRDLGVVGTVGCAAPLHDLTVGNPVGWTSLRVANPGSDLDLIIRERKTLRALLRLGFRVVRRRGDGAVLSPDRVTGFRTPRLDVRWGCDVGGRSG